MDTSRTQVASGIAGLILLLCCGCSGQGSDSAINRDPYLQQLTNKSVMICWNTLAEMPSTVEWREVGSEQWESTVSEDSDPHRHAASISGLSGGHTYEYSVTGLPGRWTFRTSPDPSSNAVVRLWVLGDSGAAGDRVSSVQAAFKTYAGDRLADAILLLGDLAYNTGTQNDFQKGLFDSLGTSLATMSAWPTFGNHDGASSPGFGGIQPYFSIFHLPTNGQSGGLASGTEHWYSFDVGRIHIVSLDSHASDRSVNGPMYRWLQQDLTATRANGASWLLAFWHHAPYSKGSHDSDTETKMAQMRQNFLPLLESHGVDVVLAGHSHAYERSRLISGHYGSSATFTPSMVLDAGDGDPTTGGFEKPGLGLMPHSGTIYVTAGSASKVGGGTLNHPAMSCSLGIAGSVVIDITGNQLDLTFIDATGTIRDALRMTKRDRVTSHACLAPKSNFHNGF